MLSRFRSPNQFWPQPRGVGFPYVTFATWRTWDFTSPQLQKLRGRQKTKQKQKKTTTVVILYFRAVSTCTQSRNSYSGSGETLHGRSCFGHPHRVCGRMRLSVAAAVETVSLALLTQMLRVAARRLRLFLLLVQRSLQHHNDAARKTALSRGPRSDRRRYHVTDCAAAYLWHWHAYPR